MVERRRLPHGGTVTLCTVVVEIPADMARICCLLKFCLMTLVAVCRQTCELVVCVARPALRGFVSPGEWKTGGCMIKASTPRKCRHLVTSGAIRRELRRHMIGVLRFLVVSPVTPYAGRGCPHILLLRRVGVACLTRHCLVSPDQRESRLLVFVDHVRHLPRFRGMTPEAVRSQLAPMHVGMTGNAVGILFCKLEIAVA